MKREIVIFSCLLSASHLLFAADFDAPGPAQAEGNAALKAMGKEQSANEKQTRSGGGSSGSEDQSNAQKNSTKSNRSSGIFTNKPLTMKPTTYGIKTNQPER